MAFKHLYNTEITTTGLIYTEMQNSSLMLWLPTLNNAITRQKLEKQWKRQYRQIWVQPPLLPEVFQVTCGKLLLFWHLQNGVTHTTEASLKSVSKPGEKKCYKICSWTDEGFVLIVFEFFRRINLYTRWKTAPKKTISPRVCFSSQETCTISVKILQLRLCLHHQRFTMRIYNTF